MKGAQRQPRDRGRLLREHVDRLSMLSREAWTMYEKMGPEKLDEKIRLLQIIADIDADWTRVLEAAGLESQKSQRMRDHYVC